VIERRRSPRGRGVAHLALLRETGRYVIGVRRPIEVFQMTSDAGGVERRVLAAYVASGAIERRVRPR